MNQPAMQNLKSKPFGGASYIADQPVLNELDVCAIDIPAMLNNTDLSLAFCEEYLAWINTTRNNTIIGLEQFPHAVQTHATTEAFDKFYIANHTRRFRCFRGEYMYHQATWRNSWPDWKFIEDEAIAENDAVIISFPFSDTGSKHQCMDKVLRRCTELGVPVLIDCCYFGTCGGLTFDFTHPCISTITFALSKTFPLSHARIGMRLTRVDDDDPAFVLQKTNYTNRIGAGIGLHLLQKFGPDYIFSTYRSTQLDFCEQLGVDASDTVSFGIGGEQYQEYNRGSSTNRLSFHKYLPTGKLPKY